MKYHRTSWKNKPGRKPKIGLENKLTNRQITYLKRIEPLADRSNGWHMGRARNYLMYFKNKKWSFGYTHFLEPLIISVIKKLTDCTYIRWPIRFYYPLNSHKFTIQISRTNSCRGPRWWKIGSTSLANDKCMNDSYNFVRVFT